MWREVERAAERAARERARRAVLKAIGFDEREEPSEDGRPPPPRLDERLQYWFFCTALPFGLWAAKACAFVLLVLVLSAATYAAVWGFVMRGLDVKSRPIYFDYSPGAGSAMPTGVVDLRSAKSAPWVHSCREADPSSTTDHVCIDNDDEVSYGTSEDGDGIGDNANRPILDPGQRYFFDIILTLPESEINKQLGTFMINVDLKSADRTLLARSRQHSQLPFESTLVSLFRKTILIVPLASGLLSETKTIRLMAFDHFVDMKDEKKSMSFVEVSIGVPNPAAFPATLHTIQIHSAEVRYGKEMNVVQSFFRSWNYFCAFWGVAVLFMGYALIALSVLHWRAQSKDTQPYADFFDSVDGSEAHDSNAVSHDDQWMGADIEILEDDENDPGAWEPIDSKTDKKEEEEAGENEDGHAGEKPAEDNLVSDDESQASKRRKVARGRESVPFPLGKLADNANVKRHEPMFTSHPNGDKDERLKRQAQEEEEKRLADMVMKG